MLCQRKSCKPERLSESEQGVKPTCHRKWSEAFQTELSSQRFLVYKEAFLVGVKKSSCGKSGDVIDLEFSVNPIMSRVATPAFCHCQRMMSTQ